jgi:hypothetical protein
MKLGFTSYRGINECGCIWEQKTEINKEQSGGNYIARRIMNCTLRKNIFYADLSQTERNGRNIEL